MNVFNYNRKTLEHCLFHKTITPLSLCKVLNKDVVNEHLLQNNIKDTNEFQHLLDETDGVVAGSFVLKLMDSNNDKLQPSDIDFFYMNDNDYIDADNESSNIQYIKKCKWNINTNVLTTYNKSHIPPVLRERSMLNKLYFGMLTILHFDLDCCRYFMVTDGNKYYIFTTVEKNVYGLNDDIEDDVCGVENDDIEDDDIEHNNKYDIEDDDENDVEDNNINKSNIEGDNHDKNYRLNQFTNYVDKFNMRSDKVWSRIKKYKERGYDFITEENRPSINVHIKGYSDNTQNNFIEDNRDNRLYLAFQHGIPLNHNSDSMTFPLCNSSVNTSLQNLISKLSNNYSDVINMYYKLIDIGYNNSVIYRALTRKVYSLLFQYISARINMSLDQNAVNISSFNELVKDNYQDNGIKRIIRRKLHLFTKHNWDDEVYMELLMWKSLNGSDNTIYRVDCDYEKASIQDKNEEKQYNRYKVVKISKNENINLNGTKSNTNVVKNDLNGNYVNDDSGVIHNSDIYNSGVIYNDDMSDNKCDNNVIINDNNRKFTNNAIYSNNFTNTSITQTNISINVDKYITTTNKYKTIKDITSFSHKSVYKSPSIQITFNTFKDSLRAFIHGYIVLTKINIQEFNDLVQRANIYNPDIGELINIFKRFKCPNKNDLHFLPHPYMQFDIEDDNVYVTHYFLHAIESKTLNYDSDFSDDFIIRYYQYKLYNKLSTDGIEFYTNIVRKGISHDEVIYASNSLRDETDAENSVKVYDKVLNIFDMIDSDQEGMSNLICECRPCKYKILDKAHIKHIKYSPDLYKLRYNNELNSDSNNYHNKHIRSDKIIRIKRNGFAKGRDSKTKDNCGYTRTCLNSLKYNDDVHYHIFSKLAKYDYTTVGIVTNENRRCTIDGKSLYVCVYGNMVIYVYEST